MNDAPPVNRIIPQLEFSNKFELVRLSEESKAGPLEDQLRLISNVMRIGVTLRPSMVWRVMVEFKTADGDIIIKIPMYDAAVQELIGSCVQ